MTSSDELRIVMKKPRRKRAVSKVQLVADPTADDVAKEDNEPMPPLELFVASVPFAPPNKKASGT